LKKNIRMKRVLNITAAIIGVLILLAAGGALWFATRLPKPAKIYNPEPSGRRVTEAKMFANYFPAPGPRRRPGILLLGGSEGGLARDLIRQAVLLQRAGYTVLHDAYHNAPGRNPQLADVPLEEFTNALDWLKRQPNVDPNAIGIVGYSKGAEAALLVATRYPGIKAVVAGMPSSVVWDGLDPLSIFFGLHSSWSQDGEKIHSLHYGWFDSDRGLYGVFEDGLKKVGQRPETVIPVEKYKGKLMLVCGERDRLWPACPMADQIEKRGKRLRGPETLLLRYPEAGHGVMGAPVPATDRDMKRFAELGGTAEANAAARADSWPKVLSFLNASLPQGGEAVLREIAPLERPAR
jgi:uncharacterized protein